jgi:hypothetical protein
MQVSIAQYSIWQFFVVFKQLSEDMPYLTEDSYKNYYRFLRKMAKSVNFYPFF